MHTQSCTLHSSSAQKCLSWARCKFKGISLLRFEWKIPPWVLGTVEANIVHSKDFVSEWHRPTTDINNDFFFFYKFWRCTYGGVPCSYLHAMWELPSMTQVFCQVHVTPSEC